MIPCSVLGWQTYQQLAKSWNMQISLVSR
jgi:hypothetical protein